MNYNELIKKYGSPLYVYDGSVLKNRCSQMIDFKNGIESELNNVKVNLHYSIKANNNPSLLKIIKESGICVDSMSPFELDICKKCGFENNEILYVCNNITKEEMKKVYESGVLMCLDSISQVNTWGELYPNTNIMIRMML